MSPGRPSVGWFARGFSMLCWWIPPMRLLNELIRLPWISGRETEDPAPKFAGIL